MPKVLRSFRVGRVHGYLRSRIWYLDYFDQGRRRRPRVGSDSSAAKQLAAQINAQLEVGAPAALSFEPINLHKLRQRWLDHHEVVLRSSVHTVNRYRTATDHLLRFLELNPVRHAALFHARHAEEFVAYLRKIKVSPNGHANTTKRPLMDQGLQFILECCRSLFGYAAKRRHLAPYAENPFRILEIDRIPIENCRSIVLMSPEQEQAFLEACDDWQFPLFLTLMLTGLRPGELCHLLLPEDLDLNNGVLHIRNKPQLGWQVKTRNERDIPLVPSLVDVLSIHNQCRRWGPVFRRRTAPIQSETWATRVDLECELAQRVDLAIQSNGEELSRGQRLRIARRFWRELGAIDEDRIRLEFIRVCKRIGLPSSSAPKVLRHQFATALQEGRVDPLIRNELMGHVAAGSRTAGHGLAMTAVYTHTRAETRREQLLGAFEPRPAVTFSKLWVSQRREHAGLSNCD
jgi:integrase